ncbi:nucleotide disphospho-sugar-binding domain-containing protein [Streptomyces sp. NPDC048191]|uniref:glycosyltransferase n=1 Tax=Streptomyces sp. NPDC048191 TaxID=3155484 RepID=UPI0033E99965
MRVLFTSIDGAGHFNPVALFVDALLERGDEVLLVVPSDLRETVEKRGYPYRICEKPSDEVMGEIYRRFVTLPPDEAEIVADREVLGKHYAEAMLPALEEACRDWRPDVLMHDSRAYAAGIAAARHGIPHVQIGISQAVVENASLDRAAPELVRHDPAIVERLHSVPFLSRFPGSLDPSSFADTRRFRDGVEPRRGMLPDWWGGSDAPLVYLTFGSVTGQLPLAGDVFRAALEAVRDLPARVLFTVGRGTDVSQLGDVPRNVHVEEWVPQADVFGEASVVVCHGGSATLLGALAAGLATVVVPVFADQPANARLVHESGVGLRVETGIESEDRVGKIGPADVPRIRAAVERVLADPSYGEAAARVAAEMRALPTISALLDGVLDTVEQGAAVRVP